MQLRSTTIVLLCCAVAGPSAESPVLARGAAGPDAAPLVDAAPADFRCASISVLASEDAGLVPAATEVTVANEGGVMVATTVLSDGSHFADGLGSKVTIELLHPFYGKGVVQVSLDEAKYHDIRIAFGANGAYLLTVGTPSLDRALYELKANLPVVRPGDVIAPLPAPPAPAPNSKAAAFQTPLGSALKMLDLACLTGNGDTTDGPIAVGEGLFTGDLADNGAEAGDADSSGFNNTIDEWLCYTAPCTGEVLATTCLPGTQFDTVLAVFLDGEEITANDDSIALLPECTLGGLNRFSTVSFPAVAGETYLFRVSAFNDAFSGHSATGARYDISIGCSPFVIPEPQPGVTESCPEPGGGNRCNHARSAYDGDNEGSTSDDLIDLWPFNESSCGGLGDIFDEFWCYTATCDGTAIASTCAYATFDTVLSVFDRCDGNELACEDDVCGNASTVSWPVVAGSSYIIRVSGYQLSHGDYTLHIKCEAEDGGEPSNCCVANGGVGCDDPECEAAVCAFDTFCCDVAWDGLCVDYAIATCGDLCEPAGGGSDSDCCTGHGTPGCDDPECESIVCAVDAFCCDVQWDGICAGEAVDLCGDFCTGGGTEPVCPGIGSCFEEQETPGCRTEECCQTVCEINPFCCENYWDSWCVADAWEYCVAPVLGACCLEEEDGDIDAVICQEISREECDAAGGVFLGDDTRCAEETCDLTPSNDLCRDAILLDLPSSVEGSTEFATADFEAPYCGTPVTTPGVWYSVIGTGGTLVASTCDQPAFDTKLSVYCGKCPEVSTEPASNCCVANGGLGCDDTDCTELICGLDAFCCDVSWDGLCAGAALDQCEICNNSGLHCVVGLDDSCGLQTEVSWCSQPGVEYLILVHGFGGQTGDFTLSVYEDEPGPCEGAVQCEPTGACCKCDAPTLGEPCTVISEEECAALGGTYFGDGTTCEETGGAYSSNPALAIPDFPVAGVSHTINVPDSFTVSDLNIRINISHTWVGDLCVEVEHAGTTVLLVQRPGANDGGSSCDEANFGCDQNNYVGVLLDDEAASPLETQCVLNLTGSFQPFGLLSDFDGANASGDWTISLVDRVGGDIGTLNSWSLEFIGGSACDPLCPVACCFANGGCWTLTQEECEAEDGYSAGFGSRCDESPCPTGACCFPDGSCDDFDSDWACAAAGGTFYGLGFACDWNPCPQPDYGACCYPSGRCDVFSDWTCSETGGEFLGAGTDCEDPNPCPQPATKGACCFENGYCDDFDYDWACDSAGGVFLGLGEACSPNPCPQPEASGACCFEDGRCEELTEDDCDDAWGWYQEDGSRCSPNPCPQPGACCLCGAGECVETVEVVCTWDLGGNFLGENSRCEDFTTTCGVPCD